MHADLCDGLALFTNENAYVQIRSSQCPSIVLLEGPHEEDHIGTQYENGVLYIPVHHLSDGANECNWKLASLKDLAVCKHPGGPSCFRPSWTNFFHRELAIFFHFSVANDLASFRFLGGAPICSWLLYMLHAICCQ